MIYTFLWTNLGWVKIMSCQTCFTLSMKIKQIGKVRSKIKFHIFQIEPHKKNLFKSSWGQIMGRLLNISQREVSILFKRGNFFHKYNLQELLNVFLTFSHHFLEFVEKNANHLPLNLITKCSLRWTIYQLGRIYKSVWPSILTLPVLTGFFS